MFWAGSLQAIWNPWKQKDPEIVFDASKLHTKEAWIAAGKLVFESETAFRPAPAAAPSADGLRVPASSDGTFPFFATGARYSVRQKGVLEVGGNSCAGCHTRVMPDGSLFEGGQGLVSRPVSAALLTAVRQSTPEAFSQRLAADFVLFGAPWLQSKEEYLKSTTIADYVRLLVGQHPGVLPRQGTSEMHPPRIPSLIGIEDIKYLDATGLVRHRSIGDLMRYAVINEGLDTLAHFGDFQPSAKPTGFSAEEGTRYSDEQLYAMALYLYSLKPPPNPNPSDDHSRRGQQIFQQQGCAGCHTPPFYTSNKLTPAQGFTVPADLLKSENILNVVVGTDPTLAMQTRRGTGFYKVPPLRGVWYRSAFGHGGQAATLEEWLDPARLKDDYLPKGFHVGPGAIQGHEFGLKLTPDDKQALIGFLKTL